MATATVVKLSTYRDRRASDRLTAARVRLMTCRCDPWTPCADCVADRATVRA